MTDFTNFISQKKYMAITKLVILLFVISGDKLMWFFKS